MYVVAGLFATNIVSSMGNSCAPALIYELVCECTFPVAEGVTNILTTTLCNAVGLLFLAAPMFFEGKQQIMIELLLHTFLHNHQLAQYNAQFYTT